MQKYLFKECPNFIKCSVNNCPLSEKYPDWDTLPGGPERKCKLTKEKRLTIFTENQGNLLYGGLTKREYIGKKHWENLTPEEKEIKRREVARIRAHSGKMTGYHIDFEGIST